MHFFAVKYLCFTHGEGRYLRSIKWQNIVEQKRSLTFVILSEYGILYGTLLATYVGQYVENESLMYEPCVRNRRVAPREDRYSLKRQILFFNILRKKKKKIEKKSNEGQNEYFLILENLCLRILFNNTIVDCRYSLIVRFRSTVVAMEATSFSMTLQPLNFSTLDFPPFVRLTIV